MTHQYHDAIDRREAKERAMRAECEPEVDPELCCCLDFIGDNDPCPVHTECTCGPNDAPACASCRARNEHDELPF
jgi:hypothetical protein